MQIAEGHTKMVPLSLRERVGVRGRFGRFRIVKAGVSAGPPHPNPLPKGEGDRVRPPAALLRKPSRRFALRRGLAPLEMALSLPILLFVMALIANFGTAACWKVRASSVAREQLWQTRFPRTGQTDPQPSYWPATATQAASGPTELTQLDIYRSVQQALVPGCLGPWPPTVAIQLNTTRVAPSVLDPTQGLRTSSATVTKTWPLLPKSGLMQLTAATQMLDNRWQFNDQQMGMGSNDQERIPVLYTLWTAPPAMAQAYVNAVVAILSAPYLSQMQPINYPMLLPNPPCYPDRAAAAGDVQNLIDRIQGSKNPPVGGVPQAVAQMFLALYMAELAADESQLNAVPPPSSAQQAAIRAAINQLQSQIAAVKQFLSTLQ